MDLRQLEMFCAVADERGFTRAGERLHVSQSAVSRQVKLLEEELGGILLHRRGRTVEPTHAGKLLLDAAKRLHRDIQDVVWQISETQELHRGSLRVSGGMTVCIYVLPRLIKKYRALYRQIDLKVASGTSEGIIREIRNHEVDLGLLTLPIDEKDLIVVPALKEEMVVLTARGHPLARRRRVPAKELARYPHIVFERGSNTRKLLELFFAQNGIAAEVAMETENVEIIKAMVANGLGIGLVPFPAVARDIRQKRFSFVGIEGLKLHREIGWVYLKESYVPRTITEMLKLFEAMRSDFSVRSSGR